jgi:hypothetical protein
VSKEFLSDVYRNPGNYLVTAGRSSDGLAGTNANSCDAAAGASTEWAIYR